MRQSPIATLLLGLIRAYRYLLSPLLAPRCRYLPTCSEYAVEAVQRHGAWRGAWLSLCRLARCHPWGGHGYDPVPERETTTGTSGGNNLRQR